MVAYQRGDLHSFDILYQRHSGRLLGYLIQKSANTSQAHDVFQATFLKLHKSRNQYDPQYPFLAWLFTLCRNELLDSFKMEKRQRDKIELFQQENLHSSELDIHSSDGNFNSTFETQSLSGNLNTTSENQSFVGNFNKASEHSLLDPLLPQQKQVIKMRYMDEETFEEIAKKLKTTPSNIRQIVSRSLKKLRGHYE